MTRRPRHQETDETRRIAPDAIAALRAGPAAPAPRGPAWRIPIIPLAVLIAAAAAGGVIGAWWVLSASTDRPGPIAATESRPPARAAPAALPGPPPSAAEVAARLIPPPGLGAAETPRPVPFEAPRLLSEAEIAALTPAIPMMVRLAENPQVFVLLFPDLESQGAALNRLAALIEKADLPRDRVVAQAELAAFLAARGEQPATWYYGHDYAGAAIARFLALAERDRIPLEEGERWLAEQYRIARAVADPLREVALISAPNPDARLDPTMRAAILRHEIGHGHFFTRPEVAAHVLRAWAGRFSEEDRARFRRFLGREGYDTTDDRLMANEAMAYLLFTPDPRFFTAAHLGLDQAGLERLRRLMAEGWPAP